MAGGSWGGRKRCCLMGTVLDRTLSFPIENGKNNARNTLFTAKGNVCHA